MNKALSKKLKANLPFAALPLILLVSIVLWINLPEEHYASVYSDSGTWDLRGFDFVNATASIHGRVKYIPAAFLSPDEFAVREDEASLAYPGVGVEPATVRVRLIVPSDDYYVITRISTGHADRVYVNGEWLRDVGNTEAGTEGLVLSHIFHFNARPVNGVITLQNQQSNFIYHVRSYRAGLLEELVYGNAYRRVEYTTNILLGIFSAVAVISMLLFLFSQKFNRPALLFALIGIAWFIHTGSMGSRAFVTIMPWHLDPLRLRLTFLITPITALLSLAIIRDLFPDLIHRYFMRSAMLVYAGWSVYFLFADIVFVLDYSLWINMGSTGVIMIYPLIKFITNFRKFNQSQAIYAIGDLVMLYAAFRDIIAHTVINLGFSNPVPPFEGYLFLRVITIAALLYQFVAVFTATTAENEKIKENEHRLAAEKTALENLTRMKTEFLQDIRHEVRNPLNNISLGADFLNQCIETENKGYEVRKTLTTVQNEAIRLGRMVNGMVELAISGETASREKVDFATMLNHCCDASQMMLKRNNNKLKVEIAPDLPFVYAQPEQLARVPDNLLSNASRSTENGEIMVKAIVDDSDIIVQISDTGEGIVPELLSRVFERGVSGKGTKGYGLSMCKTIVEAHGGTIEIESEPGKGTSVTFSIPVYGG